MPTLLHDGPAVPEQISWSLDASTYSTSATATVRYRLTSGPGAWVTGHPGYQTRAAFGATPTGTFSTYAPDLFAFMIIDLAQGTSYDVEVTVTDGGPTTVYTGTFTTRSLPGSAPAANKFANAAQSKATIQATINGLVPGDHLLFSNGTYTVTPDTNDDGYILNDIIGAHGNEIFITGESRAGVDFDTPKYVFSFFGQTSFIVFENFSVSGSFTDIPETPASTTFIGRNLSLGADGPYEEITVRNITARGIDAFVTSQNNAPYISLLVYHNDCEGNNPWDDSLILGPGPTANDAWNDDGINLNGRGNCAFYNTLKGFGDTISFANHAGGDSQAENYDDYAWGNDISNSLDDCTEMDHAFRNVAYYDNRGHNCVTAVSIDPVYAGPILYARNITINTARAQTYKLNTTQSGYFLYNNTIVHSETTATGSSAETGWYTSGGGGSIAQRSYGYRNGLLIYHGTGTRMIRLDSITHNPIDFDHNGWSDDITFHWDDGVFGSLAAAYAGLSARSPVFSGYTKRHEADVIVGNQPFTETITLGASYVTEITARYSPTLLPGNNGKNTGVVIPNITDGYSGAAPDMGAIISGRTAIVWGDPSLVVAPPSGTSSELLPRGRRLVFL